MDSLARNVGEFAPVYVKCGLALPDASPTASLSNTVCISDPNGDWAAVRDKTVEDLTEFGEIARLDSSLAVVFRCVLVTYFDVRCTQRVLMQMAGRTEPFPPAAHDCRTVRVNTAAFAEKVSSFGGFATFGEVAHISMVRGDAIVEFYDMRSAQVLLAAAGSAASPWTQAASQPQVQPAALGAGLGGLGGLAGLGLALGPELPLPATVGSQMPVSPLAKPAEAASFMSDASPTSDKLKSAERGGTRPVRTKVTTNEFSKFDIDPENIQRGEDHRTTVMVRNVGGLRARKDFLTFLQTCGLHERYTFFYMPCKEHRNVPAGFAFVNFVSPHDVHKLFVMVKSGFWREFISDPQCKAPAVSYARFQGHGELVKHFSSSAVMLEQDLAKRPIFRPEAMENTQDGTISSLALAAQPKIVPLPVKVQIDSGSDLQAALQRGAQKIAEILRQVDDGQVNHLQMGA